jgi:hypothetical protein
MAFIRVHVDGFRNRLARICARIGLALGAGRGAVPDAGDGERLSKAAIIPVLLQLKKALEAEDVRAADRLLDELSARPLDSASTETVVCLVDMVLVSEFAEAVRAIDDFLSNA